MAKLAYLGPPGTFGEEAALRFAPGAELVAFPSHSAVIGAVASGACDRGVAAIENSLEGSVPETLDSLIGEKTVSLCAETALPIRHYLLGREDTRSAGVEVIFSHPQALGQCRRFIQKHYPDAQVEAALSTAFAVKEMLEQPGAAAIGTERAALLYGASILARDIQDDNSNTTRFVLVAARDADPTGDDKTSLAFSTRDESGALVRALEEFATRGINLTKIESRPAKERLGVYVFLVDVEGHRTDPPVAEALEHLKRDTVELRVFGSYPRYR